MNFEHWYREFLNLLALLERKNGTCGQFEERFEFASKEITEFITDREKKYLFQRKIIEFKKHTAYKLISIVRNKIVSLKVIDERALTELGNQLSIIINFLERIK
jgi:hypothetical protein